MKTKFLTLTATTMLAIVMFSNCANAGSEKGTDHEDEKTTTDDHANTPNEAPGTEYPGSAGEGNNTITDTVKPQY